MGPGIYFFLFTVKVRQNLFPNWALLAADKLIDGAEWEKKVIVEAEGLEQAIGQLNAAMSIYENEHHGEVRKRIEADPAEQVMFLDIAVKTVEALGSELMYVKQEQPQR